MAPVEHPYKIAKILKYDKFKSITASPHDYKWKSGLDLSLRFKSDTHFSRVVKD